MTPFRESVIRFLAQQTGQSVESIDALVEIPKDPAHGDYAFPCFTLAREKRMAPPKIASEIAAAFAPGEWVVAARPVGPYVNFVCSDVRLAEEAVRAVSAAGARFGAAADRNETVVIDFGSPNIAKPQGVHHILSTVLGNAIAHLHEHLGYRVIRLNYLGDWGTNHGKLIAAFLRWGNEQRLAEDAVGHMLEVYVQYNREAEADPALEVEAREWFRKLEAGDPEATRIWSLYREATRDSFERVYERLGIRYDSYKGEAAYQPVLAETVKRVEDTGIARVSDGALIVDLEEYGFPVAMIRKSDGTSTYLTRDIAAAIDRYETYGFAWNIYVTQMGQQQSHFNGLFKTLELMGLEWADRCRFVGFGNMSFKGEMMSTRHGRIILLEDLLDIAEERVAAIIDEVNPDLESRDEVARMVGVGAVIFGSLLTERNKDVVFDMETAVRLDGDTSAYIQYNHARIASILRKAGGRAAALHAGAVDGALLTEPETRALALLILRFPEVVHAAADLCKPNLLARYLLDLTRAFVAFYHEHHVLTAEPAVRDARLTLLSCVKSVLATGLGLLGIGAPEEM